MADKIITLKQLVEHFQLKWFLGDTNPQKRGFWFGYPQEIDNQHKKQYPFMMVYPPQMKFKLDDLRKGIYLAHSSFTIVFYDYLPSEYKIKNETSAPLDLKNDGMAYSWYWAELMSKVESWWAGCWNRLHTIPSVEVTPEWWDNHQTDFTEPLNIEFLSDATNDRTLGIKITFGISHYRYCELELFN
tara:strand:- start:458 stop:1018 length:561 start_codon:yes stop_codon:yes gene_type:complete